MLRAGQLVEGQTLPLLVEAETGDGCLEALLSWMEVRREWLAGQLDSTGAVLLRGFGISNDQDFEIACRALVPELKLYIEGNSPRKHTSDFVYTSTEYPREFDISMHSELSYAASPPNQLFFYCKVPPQTGGETPIVDCRVVLELLDPALVKRFDAHGIKYVQNIHGGAGLGKSWQETFETDSHEEVENYLRKNGVTFIWGEDGGLRTEQIRAATRIDEKSGERVWFNQADQWHPTNLDSQTREALTRFLPESQYPLNAFLGDGSAINAADLDAVRSTLWDAAVRFTWQAGDLLVVNNNLVAHGRCSYSGERSIRVAIA